MNSEANERNPRERTQPPRDEDSGQPTQFPPPLRVCRKNDPLNPKPIQIVVVNDEAAVNDALELIISYHYAVSVKWFTSSVDAWAELQRADPDMLITDDMMPRILGEELVRRLLERGVTYPIITLFSYRSEDYLRAMFPLACNLTYFSTPVGVDQLVAELGKHFVPAPAQ